MRASRSRFMRLSRIRASKKERMGQPISATNAACTKGLRNDAASQVIAANDSTKGI